MKSKEFKIGALKILTLVYLQLQNLQRCLPSPRKKQRKGRQSLQSLLAGNFHDAQIFGLSSLIQCIILQDHIALQYCSFQIKDEPLTS